MRAEDILALALEAVIRTLRQGGIRKVLAGHIDMRQVRAACVK